MATYDSFVNNENNPFVELKSTEGNNPVRGRENQPLFTSKTQPPPVEDSENDEEAPNSGFVIHVATEPGKGKAVLFKFIGPR